MFLVIAMNVVAQDKNAPASARLEKLFWEANTLMEANKFAAALPLYKEALEIEPEEPSLLYNGGLAAYQTKDFATAVDLWARLKKVDPEDWRARTKLIQAYQASGKFTERDAERAELFTMWKSGKDPELAKEFEYCREQFQVNKIKVMAFEQFELKGDRALRYVFSILNEQEDGEEYRISLGSYDLTNAIWHESTKPKPRPEERLFHLDGYFKGAHATYGMYTKEPTYDQVRDQVIKILEGRVRAASTSTVNPAAQEPAQKPKP
jgi:tetratricopeptide (TPR) repeat protein